MDPALIAQIQEIETKARAEAPDALARASALIEQYPSEARIWSLRAYIHGRAGAYMKAVGDLTRAICIAPTEPVLFFNRGRKYAKLGNYRLAAEDFSQGLAACDLHSNDYYRESLHFHRAYSYLKLGEKARAR